jgi:hypothetical protein
MLRLTRKFVRPNVNVDFYSTLLLGSDLASYIQKTYKDTNKLISTDVSYSDDTLTMTYEAVWTNWDDYNAYLQDPRIREHFNSRNDYNFKNGIADAFRNIVEI